MIRWVGSAPRLEGFVFYPLLECGFGVFLILVCWLPLFFHLRINGVHFKNGPEWIFSLLFLVFFFWMGKTLTFQSFRATVRSGELHISQNLREPPVSFGVPVTEIVEWRIGEGKDDRDDKELKTLLVVTRRETRELYRSVNRGEVETLLDALKALIQGGP